MRGCVTNHIRFIARLARVLLGVIWIGNVPSKLAAYGQNLCLHWRKKKKITLPKEPVFFYVVNRFFLYVTPDYKRPYQATIRKLWKFWSRANKATGYKRWLRRQYDYRRSEERTKTVIMIQPKPVRTKPTKTNAETADMDANEPNRTEPAMTAVPMSERTRCCTVLCFATDTSRLPSQAFLPRLRTWPQTGRTEPNR